MKNLREIRKILEFYASANQLKTTYLDEDKTISVASHLFGSMILAVAINSEFKEVNKIGKVIRMLFLNEYEKLHNGYDFDNLKAKDCFNSCVEEYISNKTAEANLATKSELLDILLTKFIIKYSKVLDEKELLKQGAKIVAENLGYEEEKCKEIFRFFLVNYKLKVTERSGFNDTHWNIIKERETISEHIVGTIALATIIGSEFSHKINLDTVLETLVIHETGETLSGKDNTPFDGVSEVEQMAMERAVWRKALGKLKERTRLFDRLNDFLLKSTEEARFAFYCDKLEADLQAKIYQEKGYHHSLDDQEKNCVFKSEKVHRMVKNGAKTPFDIWYEYDRPLYFTYPNFSEFLDILKASKDNELLKITDGPYCNTLRLVEKLSILNHNYLNRMVLLACNECFENPEFETAYLTSYQNPDSGKKVIKVTVIKKPFVAEDKYKTLMDEITHAIEVTNHTDIIIEVETKRAEDFLKSHHTTEERKIINEFAHSAILFDKSGEFTRLHDSLQNYNSFFVPKHLFLVDYEPPVELGVQKEFKIKATN